MTIDLPTYITRAVFISDIIYQYYCRAGSLSNYQKRDLIKKQEILDTIEAMRKVKQNSVRMKDKHYLHKWMYKVMMVHFYMVCAILKNENIISPGFRKREIRDVMKTPLRFKEVLRLRGWRVKNLAIYLLGVLPPSLSLAIIRKVGKYKGLI